MHEPVTASAWSCFEWNALLRVFYRAQNNAASQEPFRDAHDVTCNADELGHSESTIVEETKKDKKRSGAGGAWRAYCHERLRGQHFTPELMQEVRRDYHSLSDAEKERLKEIGRLATRCHAAGGSGFPAYSKRAQHARGVSSDNKRPNESCNNDERTGAAPVPASQLVEELLNQGCTLAEQEGHAASCT
eukprot:6492807-Amphidinium_carterae.5